MQETMTSRQRVLAAIEHRPVDRMPIDLGVHFSTGISIFAYWNLREYLGLSTDRIELVDCMQLLARVDDDILDRFHVDTVLLNPPFPHTRIWNPRGKYRFIVPEAFDPVHKPDGAWEIRRENGIGLMPAGGYFFDGLGVDGYGMDEKERLAYFARRAEMLHKETDRFTLQMGFSGYFDGLDFACDMLTDPDDCKSMLEERLHGQIARFDRINAAYGRYINALEVNSDLGMQSGPMCTPESYRDICMPFLKRFNTHVHENSDIKVFMHACGSLAPLLPYIIEAGVDILNPVQISAADMDPRMLKETYGKQICFWGGGCDTQRVLPCATPEEVRENVRSLVEVFAPGSGFVFNQVHNIMGDVPPENIVAMYDTAYALAWDFAGSGAAKGR